MRLLLFFLLALAYMILQASTAGFDAVFCTQPADPKIDSNKATVDCCGPAKLTCIVVNNMDLDNPKKVDHFFNLCVDFNKWNTTKRDSDNLPDDIEATIKSCCEKVKANPMSTFLSSVPSTHSRIERCK